MSVETEERISRMEAKLDEAAAILGELSRFIEAVSPLVTTQQSRKQRADALNISPSTLSRRQRRARVEIAMKGTEIL